MARRHRPWVRPAPAWLGCGWLRELLSGMASGLHHALPACLHTPSVAFPTCQYVGATFPCLGSAMVGLQYFNEHSAVAGAESEEDPLCCVLSCSTRWHPGLLSAERPKTPSGRTAPHAPVIFFCGEGDKVRAAAVLRRTTVLIVGGLLQVCTPCTDGSCARRATRSCTTSPRLAIISAPPS